MKKLTRKTANVVQVYPERILQFGGGNFLRGFVDWIIDKYNRQSNDEKIGILAVKVRREGTYQDWKDQDGLFHLFSKGYANGRIIDERILIKSIVRILEVHNEYDAFIESAKNPELNIIVSNTTETGITFDDRDKNEDIPHTFPGQLCQWLYARWKFFQDDKKGNCIVIPCELIEHNGDVLKQTLVKYAMHWQLEEEFKNWLDHHCQFCNSLVDRIVPGINRSALSEYQQRTGYEDKMITEGEPYHLWAIESRYDLSRKLPLDRIGLNVIFTKNLEPFKELKLKILNGTHTTMTFIGLLMGVDLVKDIVNHEVLEPFTEKLIFEEIIPSISLDRDTSIEYGKDVLERFKNPFLEHRLQSISLYSISKFSTRIKPTIKAYKVLNDKLPERLMLSFSSLLIFYKGALGNQFFTPNDEAFKIEKIKQHWNKINAGGVISAVSIYELLADEELWAENLNDIDGFSANIAGNLVEILNGNLAEKVSKLSN
ncbi:UNVERIFIED_CONTAM: hypothetical protein GTU68_027827 [Idotea baltica]|nr:hypothetical protein [Idotea baltica]